MATLQDIYAAPEVRGLRAALDSYIAGDSAEYAAKLLRGTPTSVLKNRFLLLEDDQGQFGGSFLTVQFKNWLCGDATIQNQEPNALWLCPS